MSVRPTLLQTVLDARDVRGLAEFYRALLGLEYRPGDEPPAEGPDDADWLVLCHPGGARALAVQRADGLVASTWPDPAVPMQLHLDLTVPDVAALEEAREAALALGARLVADRSDDPDEPLYVLADPAGHPFCVFVACGAGAAAGPVPEASARGARDADATLGTRLDRVPVRF